MSRILALHHAHGLSGANVIWKYLRALYGQRRKLLYYFIDVERRLWYR